MQIADNIINDLKHDIAASPISDVTFITRCQLETLEAALSAQVLDKSETVDCLLAGKPFVFDPATNFCHADDGGAPEHGIKYVPASWVQDVAGWQPIETAPRDGTTVLLYAPGWGSPKTGWTYGKDDWQDCPYSRSGDENYQPSHWMPLPAAPAKQEG